jgi:geranylgeranyl pyrophosphate synthase
VAVECFHKASLVHDDIEDGDEQRYGRQSLHAAHGVPVALNVGDFLLGEGYRLVAAADVPADRRAQMLHVAADGHRELTLGQGAELCWRSGPRPLSSAEVLDIFRRKTAPAFDVALRLGAVCAGATAGVTDVLGRYSEHLGIAYQIRDDLEDLAGDEHPGDAEAMRPSVVLALAHERAEGAAARLLEDLWRGRVGLSDGAVAGDVAATAAMFEGESAARELLNRHRQQAIAALAGLDNATLKGLLRRVLLKIFTDVDRADWCGEHQTGHADRRRAGAEPAG